MGNVDDHKISVVIICCNEAGVIGQCLDRVVHWADETVVVDLQSDDGSRAIVTASGARLVDHPWVDHAERIRQWAIEQTRHEYVLIIDPDEYVPAQLARTLREAASAGEVDVVFLPIQGWMFKRPMGDAKRQLVPRFFRRNCVRWPEHIHSLPPTTGLRALYLPFRDDLALEHDSWRTVQHSLAKINRYAGPEAAVRISSGFRYSHRGMLMAAFDTFARSFVTTKGYREGGHGFVSAILWTMHEIQVHLYVWEAQGYREISPSVARGWANGVRAVHGLLSFLRVVRRTLRGTKAA